MNVDFHFMDKNIKISSRVPQKKKRINYFNNK